jgi:hypothetical protein
LLNRHQNRVCFPVDAMPSIVRFARVKLIDMASS